jgi:putative OPT family oligopeptide transporter
MAGPQTVELERPQEGSIPPAHQPYVPDRARLHEFTWPAVGVGTLLGIVFAASSVYLVLKVGMTISASIPVAVLSITVFRVFSRVFGCRRTTILENNIVQTAGSAGESIAAGIGVTMPGLMLLGFEMEIGRVILVASLGGILGVLMMIPLRRAFIVKRHGTLKYPEGTACADVLIVGEQGGASARTVFAGFGIAFVYQFLWQGLRLWKEVVKQPLGWFRGAAPSIEVNPALLGVGYIIGTRIACVMFAGGVLAYMVMIPTMHFFGDHLTAPLAPGTIPISSMTADDMRDAYVLYVGAGAVAAGGIIGLLRALPLIVGSLAGSLRDIRPSQGKTGSTAPVLRRRTDRDVPMKVVGIGTMLLMLAIWITLPLGTSFGAVNLVAAVLIVLFGFLFVTVSSRLTGEIGSSSNPVSGMTVATLLLTCLIFLMLGWTDAPHRLIALTVAGIVCVAASNGGATSQDLKTGFLVGATPKYQQFACLIGTVSSALVIGWVLVVLNHASTVYSTKDLPHLATPLDVGQLTEREQAPDDDALYYVWHVANENRDSRENPEGVPKGKYLVDAAGQICYLVDPGINGKRLRRDDGTEVQKFMAPKAVIMALITDGILRQKLPWTLVLLGVFIALVLELVGAPSLPFAVGVYLPLSSSAPIFVGGVVRYVADRWARTSDGRPRSASESDMSPGVLLSTGYIAGGAIGGILIALISISGGVSKYLSVWQYPRYTVTRVEPLAELYRDAAVAELGLDSATMSDEQRDRVASLAEEICKLNADQIPRYAAVAAGTVLKLPHNQSYEAAAGGTLAEAAQQSLANADKASLLFDLNTDRLQLPAALPVGATLKLPQRVATALLPFAALAVLLALVGAGWLFRAPPPPLPTPAGNGAD